MKNFILIALLTSCNGKPAYIKVDDCICTRQATVNLICYSRYDYYKILEVDDKIETAVVKPVGYDGDVDVLTYITLSLQYAKVTCPEENAK